jgi:DNA invertase Pin-like site-specific DNA recombinase
MAHNSNSKPKVAAYCRLSKDDGDKDESQSIATQRTLISDYAQRQGWQVAEVYTDDGYTGTNFNRPAFQRLIADIEKGIIDCVITKDLSRLGRNYLDCGLYLEVFFPEHGVRYIAVNDGVDTLSRQSMDITPFKNILNDMYSADVSMKIKSAKRTRFKEGKYMGTTAPYGYRKDPEDKNHLVIDEEVAPVVREIYDLALSGWGTRRICRHLRAKGVLRPSAYAELRGDTVYSATNAEDWQKTFWSENGVRGILRSAVYAGHLTGYKRPQLSLKSKKRPSRLPEDWEVVPNTHEAIISQCDFDTVQAMMTSRRQEPKGLFDNIFAGLVYCEDCGYVMRASAANRRKKPEPIDCIVYCCNNYGSYGNTNCSAHSIEARTLFETVLADINHHARLATTGDAAVKALQKKLAKVTDTEAKALSRERRKLEKRTSELDRLFAALYEDKVSGNITERNYKMMAEKYEAEQEAVSERLGVVVSELEAKGVNDRGAADFVGLIRDYDGITELTPAILNALIERITVSEKYTGDDGQKEQRITINYRFVGSVSDCTVAVPKRLPAVLPDDKPCERCGKVFSPKSNVTKYCEDCRPIVYKEMNDRACAKRTAKRRAAREAERQSGAAA